MRFDVFSVFRGHLKGLTDGTEAEYRPDWIARLILTLPLVVFGLVFYFGGKLMAPASLLAACALLAGGMLSSFSHLSNLRTKVTEWADGDPEKYAVERDMLDETAAHLLTGSLMCVVDVAVIVAGMNFGSSSNGTLVGFWAALASCFSSYVLLIFILIIPRLYSAWVELNDVSPKLSGFAKREK